MSSHVLIIGATSAIAGETARLYARRGGRLFLVGRDAERLAILADDLRVLGAADVACFACDLTDFDRHPELVAKAREALGRIDVALIAHGILGDQRAEEADFDQARANFTVNALSPISLLTRLAPVMREQGGGTLAAIASVAGDRGRQSNFVYGAAKGALAIYLQGLRNRLHADGVHVLTIKPGFVDTPMTRDFPKGPLWVGPEVIARGIVRAVERRRNVVYLPWFWRPIMAIIKAIPEPLFKRLKL